MIRTLQNNHGERSERSIPTRRMESRFSNTDRIEQKKTKGTKNDASLDDFFVRRDLRYLLFERVRPKNALPESPDSPLRWSHGDLAVVRQIPQRGRCGSNR